MNEQDLRVLLHRLQVNTQRVSYTGSKSGTRWMNISCPFAPWTHAKGSDNNPSFGVTINDDGRSSYKCLACGMKGRVSSLPTRLGGYRKRDYRKLRLWAELVELKASVAKPLPDWDDAAPEDDDDAREENTPPAGLIRDYPSAAWHPYLRERGIRFPTPYRLDLRYDAYQRRILFPCYDSKGRFRGFTGRSTRKGNSSTRGSDPKVRDYFGLKKREVFLGLRNPPAGKKVLVEGLFDYARLVQAGFPAARAILGTSLTPEKLDILIREGDPVYFFMDNDLAGWSALFGTIDANGETDTTNAWAYALFTELPVWIVPYRTEFDGADPGSLPDKEVRAAVNRAWLFTGKAPVDDLGNPNLLPPAVIKNP